jgi:hypothetical protein
MAYAVVADLALALHKQRFDGREQKQAEDCLDVAAGEIDGAADWFGGVPPLLETLTPYQRAGLLRINVDRAVEWWKGAEAAFGAMGYADIGVLRAPRDDFARFEERIIRLGLKEQFGIS